MIETVISALVGTRLPTLHGEFEMKAFESGKEDVPHLALAHDLHKNTVTNVRIHSECMTGDVFGSTRCDCGEQLHASMTYVREHGGVVVYLRQEGRGIGLINKLKAYNLQDQGLDTVEANLALGFPADGRDFQPAIAILKSLGVTKVNLLTNNPDKIHVFDQSGIELVSRTPLIIEVRPENKSYIETKRNVMGHQL